jgi:hypothetical protein
MLLKIGIVAGVIAFCFFTVVSLAVYQAGFLILDVKDKANDRHIFAPVPMFAVNLTMDLIPNYRLNQFSTKLPASVSLLQKAGMNLNDCPDGIFVEVESRHDYVRVEKRSGNILVRVNTPDQNVFIQVPIASTTRVISRLVEVSESNSESQREL